MTAQEAAEAGLDAMEAWMKEPGRAVISVMHDLSLAKAFGTRVLLLKAKEMSESICKRICFSWILWYSLSDVPFGGRK